MATCEQCEQHEGSEGLWCLLVEVHETSVPLQPCERVLHDYPLRVLATRRLRPATKDSIFQTCPVAHRAIRSGFVPAVGVQRERIQLHQNLLVACGPAAPRRFGCQGRSRGRARHPNRRWRPSASALSFRDRVCVVSPKTRAPEGVLHVARVDAVVPWRTKAPVHPEDIRVRRVDDPRAHPQVKAPEDGDVRDIRRRLAPLHTRANHAKDTRCSLVVS
eukprot:7382120-Prymnesium_polylepis.1